MHDAVGQEAANQDNAETVAVVLLDCSGYDYYMSEEKNPAAVELGRLGGKKGGKARAEKMTKEQRSEIARKAAKTRWEEAFLMGVNRLEFA